MLQFIAIEKAPTARSPGWEKTDSHWAQKAVNSAKGTPPEGQVVKRLLAVKGQATGIWRVAGDTEEVSLCLAWK